MVFLWVDQKGYLKVEEWAVLMAGLSDIEPVALLVGVMGAKRVALLVDEWAEMLELALVASAAEQKVRMMVELMVVLKGIGKGGRQAA